MPDAFPHETVVAWARNAFKKHPIPKGDLDDMEQASRARFKECAKFINKNYDVEGLHKQFPTRLQELIDRKGDHLTQH